MSPTPASLLPAFVLALATGGCRTAQPPAVPLRPPAHAADVGFMQGMILHHAQAVQLTGLVPERAARPELHVLAERIAVSQRDEIALMQRWLRERGQPADGPHTAHTHAAMPGMLSTAELQRLAEAKGEAFDRLFLELMIRHHEGALIMVETLFASEGARQDPEIFQFATGVDADQRAEIDRMRRLLASFPQRGYP